MVELDFMPTPPSQNDPVASEANNPQIQNEQEAEVRIIGLDGPGNQVKEGEIAPDQEIGKQELTQESGHELQQKGGNKDDTTVEGEQKEDGTQEPSRTEEQPLLEDTQQLLSEVGENSIE